MTHGIGGVGLLVSLYNGGSDNRHVAHDHSIITRSVTICCTRVKGFIQTEVTSYTADCTGDETKHNELKIFRDSAANVSGSREPIESPLSA